MSTRALVIAFLFVTAIVGGYFGAPFFSDRTSAATPFPDKRMHLPGDTSNGHYQIEIACNQCHTPFGGVKNDACNKCHGEALTAENNSHPIEKFRDPRYADQAAALNAMECVTCHREHVPDRTKAGGVTIADDFCTKCHNSEDLAGRPTHKDLPSNGCTSSGCHNFHDNRALYEDFLKKHLHEPDQLAVARVALRTSGPPAGKDIKPLTAKDEDAPPAANPTPEQISQWEGSAHAKADVNCVGCHRVSDPSTGAARWQSKIDHRACSGCHDPEHTGFLEGRHGMRIGAGLSPMKPGMARLPMKPGRKTEEVGCSSCHKAHAYNTGYAAVDACLTCHDDQHSNSYKASRHAKLWDLEQEGKAEKGTGVSCATCHLPREVHKEGAGEVTRVQHNQNANLRPNDKMLRSVCTGCHGLAFSMNALADRILIQRNFNGRPGLQVASLGMVEQRLGAKSKKGE